MTQNRTPKAEVGTRWTLHPDTVTVAVDDLDPATPGALAADLPEGSLEQRGARLLKRRNSRGGSLLIDPETAELIDCFGEGETLARAVLRWSDGRDDDAETVLRQAWPTVERLVRRGFLVDASLPRPSSEPVSALGVGARIELGSTVGDGWRVLRRLRRLEDSELYLLRSTDRPTVDPRRRVPHAVLKLQRPGAGLGDLTREAEVLAALEGDGAPRSLGRGTLPHPTAPGGPPWDWLLIAHVAGIGVRDAASELGQGPSDWRRRLDLLLAVTRAYARLHARGWLHGDVHAGNLLVDRDGGVILLDFALARRRTEPPGRWPGSRPGVPTLFEPEVARALLAGHGAPTVSPAGEQFAVAALLYQLFCGTDYRRFGLSHETLYRQIAEEPMRPFAETGTEPWPALEAVLERALSKQPEDRFTTLEDFGRALESLASESPTSGPPKDRPDPLAAVAARVHQALEPGGEAFSQPLPAPTASLKHGAAGTAFALYRWAQQRDDATTLALAELWSRRARAEIEATDGPPEEAFYAPHRGLERETLGSVTPFHTASGVHAVAALVAGALGDWQAFGRATRRFVEASHDSAQDPSEPRGWDLTLGRAGTLLACTLLEDRRPEDCSMAELGRLAEKTLEALWRHLEALGPLSEAEDGGLGIAHGWGGQLYAILLWRSLIGGDLPEGFEDRLKELARLAIPVDRGLAWPWQRLTATDRSHRWMAGWCNGSSGLVSLWALAADHLDTRYLELAKGAAWHTWESTAEVSNLCCGLVGRAYALLRVHRATGESHWLEKARELAARAGEMPRFDRPLHSLYRGEVALALLAVDLEHPESAVFPFFETEGWQT